MTFIRNLLQCDRLAWAQLCILLGRTPHLWPHWSGRRRGVQVAHEVFHYFIACTFWYTCIYIRQCIILFYALKIPCISRENATTSPLQRLQARQRSHRLTRNNFSWPCFPPVRPHFVAAKSIWPNGDDNNAGFFPWINLPDMGSRDISKPGLIKPNPRSIIKIFAATLTLLAIFACLPPSLYFRFILRDRYNISAYCRLPSWWLSLLHSINSSKSSSEVDILRFRPATPIRSFTISEPFHKISETKNVNNHFFTSYSWFAVLPPTVFRCKKCCLLSDIHSAVVDHG